MAKAHRETEIPNMGTIWRYEPPFEDAIRQIEKRGQRILSAQELAYARQRVKLDHTLQTIGSIVREGIFYRCRDPPKLLSDFVRFSGYCRSGFSEQDEIKYLQYLPKSSHFRIRTANFHKHPITQFLFADEAGRYASFMRSNNTRAVSVCLFPTPLPISKAYPIWIGPHGENMRLNYDGFEVFSNIRALSVPNQSSNGGPRRDNH